MKDEILGTEQVLAMQRVHCHFATRPSSHLSNN
jgi:hypothetical protein